MLSIARTPAAVPSRLCFAVARLRFAGDPAGDVAPATDASRCRFLGLSTMDAAVAATAAAEVVGRGVVVAVPDAARGIAAAGRVFGGEKGGLTGCGGTEADTGLGFAERAPPITISVVHGMPVVPPRAAFGWEDFSLERGDRSAGSASDE